MLRNPFNVVFLVLLSTTIAKTIPRFKRDNGTIEIGGCTEGSEYNTGRVKLQCKNGIPVPTACIGSERINGQEIAINSTKTVDGFWYKCQLENNTVRYTEESRCTVGGKTYRMNETVKATPFIFKCANNAIIPIGCFFVDSKGKEVETQIGQTAVVDGVQHQCMGMSGPGATKWQNQMVTGAPACIYEGKTYKPGEKFPSSNERFMYSCNSNATVTATDCVLKPGTTLPIGETLVKDGVYHSCSRTPMGVSYRTQVCNFTVICEGPNAGQPMSGNSVQQAPFNASSSSSSWQQTGVSGMGGETMTESGSSQVVVQTGSKHFKQTLYSILIQNTFNGYVINAINQQQPTQCFKNNKPHQFNEIWSENGFKFLCQPDGSIKPTACIADDGSEIEVGQKVVKDRLQHDCTARPGGVVYVAKVCGVQVDCGSGAPQQPQNSGVSINKTQSVVVGQQMGIKVDGKC